MAWGEELDGLEPVSLSFEIDLDESKNESNAELEIERRVQLSSFTEQSRTQNTILSDVSIVEWCLSNP